MSATFWKVFELAISVWENILLLEFCMDFMQQKPKGKKGKILWGSCSAIWANLSCVGKVSCVI